MDVHAVRVKDIQDLQTPSGVEDLLEHFEDPL